MKEIVKSIILDYQEVPLETGVPRHLEVETVPRKANVCIGVRRCGKSTYMFQRMERLVERGVPRSNILYLDFFDDRLHDLRHTGLGVVAEAYYSLYPEKKGREPVYCFLDEIQVIPNWEPFVERLLRTERVEVFITGSSAQMLSREIATSMRGRALTWELFPFSFAEFLDWKGLDWRGPLSTRRRLQIERAFSEYWETGGFPEVLGLSPFLRTKVHQEYFHAIVYRDVVERHDVSHPRALQDLVYRLVDNVASMYTVNSLTGYLKSLGHRVPKASVSDYLDWLEDAFFLFTVRKFDASVSRSRANPKKVYCIDHALVSSVSSGILVNSGHLLENLVFEGLRRRTGKIWYWRNQAGQEVDFLAQLPDRKRLLVQVCESLAAPTTRRRELRALEAAMVDLGLSEAIVVTRAEEETLRMDSGVVRIVPAWRFLLDLEDE